MGDVERGEDRLQFVQEPRLAVGEDAVGVLVGGEGQLALGDVERLWERRLPLGLGFLTGPAAGIENPRLPQHQALQQLDELGHVAVLHRQGAKRPPSPGIDRVESLHERLHLLVDL